MSNRKEAKPNTVNSNTGMHSGGASQNPGVVLFQSPGVVSLLLEVPGFAPRSPSVVSQSAGVVTQSPGAAQQQEEGHEGKNKDSRRSSREEAS